MRIFDFDSWKERRQESKAENGPVQNLEKLRAQMLDLEVEAAQAEAQLQMRGMERHPGDAKIGDRLDEITGEYQQLLSQFRQALKIENDRRFNAGEAPLEMVEPSDDEITTEIQRRNKLAA